jgi:MFS family permease
MNLVLFRAAIIAALGGLLFGFDTAVISGTTDQLRNVFGLTPNTLGFTVASALIGTIFGAMLAGRPSDLLGRRTTLIWIAGLYFVSAVGSALAWDWYAFLIFRLIGGLGVGASSVVAPTYIAEISPAAYRGRLVALTQFNIVAGILVAYVSNYGIAQFEIGADAWRLMFGVEALPAVLFFVLLFATPLSPRWLVGQQRSEEAVAVLRSLGAVSAEKEVSEIEQSLALERHELQEPLFQKAYRKPILLAIAVGGTNLAFTMVGLALIDHLGRRALMIVGSIGYIVSLTATAAAFYTYGTNFDDLGATVVLLSLLVFIAAHAVGQGAVIWVFLSETFPTRVRARGQALGSFTHWFFAALVSWTFPVIAEISGGHTFAFYAVMMVAQLIWVWRVMPETKGVPLEEIQKRLGIE